MSAGISDHPTGRAAFRRLGGELLAALTVGFLLFGPYLSQFMKVGSRISDDLKGRNAFWFLWQPHDVVFLLGCMASLAAAATAFRECVRWWGRRWALRLFDHGFVIALGGGMLANLWFHTQRPAGYRIGQFGMEMQTAWLALFALVGYSLASPDSRLVEYCRKLCQIISPAIVIVVYQLARLPTLPEPMEPLDPPQPPSLTITPIADRPDRPVYLFIFDEWSYRRTYERGQPKPPFRRLAELSSRSITFHDAHAPGTKTVVSIPAMLRPTTHQPEVMGIDPGFVVDERFVPASHYPSIFTVAGCSDYRKIMVQWGFAVNLWVADELDAARSYSCHPRGDGFFAQAGLHLYNAAFFWTDPWSIFAYEKLRPRVQDGYMLGVYRRMRRDITRVIRDQPARTFAIVHYPVPHPPYLLKADGAYRGADPKNQLTANEGGYERNLAYLDTLIGQIVTELESAGRFEECLLILTSDHSWRQDPAEGEPNEEALTHVPLVVKLPGQTGPVSIPSRFHTYLLGELVARGLNGRAQPSQIAEWLSAPPAPESHAGSRIRTPIGLTAR